MENNKNLTQAEEASEQVKPIAKDGDKAEVKEDKLSENKNSPAPKQVRNKFATEKRKRTMPKWLKTIISLVVLAAVAWGLYYLVGILTKKEEAAQLTDMVTTGTLSSNVTGYGSVSPKNKQEYGAKTQGTVTEVYVKAGDLVKKGDKLFSIDPSALMADLEKANKTKKAALTSLKAAIESLENTSVNAPFKGKLIDAVKIKTGDDVAAGTKLGTLVDDSNMLLELYFSYAYADQIKVGQSANVSVSQSMTYISGTVSQVDKIKKVTTDGSILFRVYVSVPNPGTLTKDTPAVATIKTSQGEATPAEGGKLDYLSSQDITAKVGGKASFANVINYGEYKAGQNILTIKGDGLEDAVSEAQKVYDTAQEKVNELTTSIENKDIVAGIDGMVSAIMVSVGDKLTASGTSVLSISDTSSLFVEVNVDELDVNKLSVGMPATIIYRGGAEPKEWQGTLTYLSFEAKRQEGGMGGGSVAYFPAKIAVENDGTLLPNMNVDFKMTSTVKENCLLVPSAAIVYSDKGTVVYVKNESLKGDEIKAEIQSESIPKGFTAVNVEIGLSDDRSTEILSGLSEGMEIASKAVTDDKNNSMGGSIMVG